MKKWVLQSGGGEKQPALKVGHLSSRGSDSITQDGRIIRSMSIRQDQEGRSERQSYDTENLDCPYNGLDFVLKAF